MFNGTSVQPFSLCHQPGYVNVLIHLKLYIILDSIKNYLKITGDFTLSAARIQDTVLVLHIPNVARLSTEPLSLKYIVTTLKFSIDKGFLEVSLALM